MVSTKVTQAERDLIEDLLRDGFKPIQVEMLQKRKLRTIYYIQAEMERRGTVYQLKPFFQRLVARLTGGELYESKESGPGKSRA